MSWALLDTVYALGNPLDVLLYTFSLIFLRLKTELIFVQEDAGIIIRILWRTRGSERVSNLPNITEPASVSVKVCPLNTWPYLFYLLPGDGGWRSNSILLLICTILGLSKIWPLFLYPIPYPIMSLTLDISLMTFISFSHTPNACCPHHVLTGLLSSHLKCPLSSPSPSNPLILYEQFNLPHSWQVSLWLGLTSSLASHNTVYFYHTYLVILFSNCLYFISAPRLQSLRLCVLAQCQAQFNSQTHKHTCWIYSWQTK